MFRQETGIQIDARLKIPCTDSEFDNLKPLCVQHAGLKLPPPDLPRQVSEDRGIRADSSIFASFNFLAQLGGIPLPDHFSAKLNGF